MRKLPMDHDTRRWALSDSAVITADSNQVAVLVHCASLM